MTAPLPENREYLVVVGARSVMRVADVLVNFGACLSMLIGDEFATLVRADFSKLVRVIGGRTDLRIFRMANDLDATMLRARSPRFAKLATTIITHAPETVECAEGEKSS